jgi:hypothetical protein
MKAGQRAFLDKTRREGGVLTFSDRGFYAAEYEIS